MALLGPSSGLCPLPLLVLSVVFTVASAQFGDQETAVWEVSEYGPCTSPCGGGLQVRRVTCVKYISWSGYSDKVKITATESQCPEPVPPKSRSCNSHMCRARWAPKEWAECSTTCGLGTQTREVHCEVSWSSRLQLAWGDRHHVSASECGGTKPISARACYPMDCPVFDDPDQPVIVAENYTLWQLKRTRRINAKVGGELNLLPGQEIVIRCPVRHPSVEQLIYWSKDKKLLTLHNHLTIKRANPDRDAGTYTCTAQHDSATVTIKFIKNNNPVSAFYKKWIRKNKRRKRWMASKSPKASAFSASRASSTRKHRKRGAEESSKNEKSSRRSQQQRDQSRNGRRRHQKRDNTRRKRRKRSLTLNFVTGSWSKCNATCHSKGQRSREVTCSQVTWKYAKVMAEDKCLKAGLVKPISSRACFHRERCAVWVPGPWTKCQPDCGQVSFKTRYLVCQWSNTKQLAWNACDPKRKPETFKHCKAEACTKECHDKSRSCKLASHLRMCRYANFRNQCCHSCRAKQHSGPSQSWRHTNLS